MRGQDDREVRPLADRALDLDPAVMGLHDPLADGQPQAGTLEGTREGRGYPFMHGGLYRDKRTLAEMTWMNYWSVFLIA